MTVDAHSPALGDLVRALTALDYGPAMLLHALGREGYGEALAGDPGPLSGTWTGVARQARSRAPGRIF